jgi:hypothetical protein
MCNACDEPILSDSFRGQGVELYLLRAGEVLESMRGQYDSYGKVFDPERGPAYSLEWEMDWNEAVGLHHNDSDGDGFAAVHTKCIECDEDYLEPVSISADDPNQGWGS